MTLGEQMLHLARLTLRDPRQAARNLLAEGVPMPARTGGLMLVAVVSALLLSLQVGPTPQAVDPFTALMTASPFRAAIMQWLFLALSVLLVYLVGRAFGGRGSLADSLLVVVWLQGLLLVVQVLQLILSLVMPPLAGVVGLVGLGLFLWLMTVFVAVLHGFRSQGLVFLGMVLTGLGTGLVLGIALILFLGPEAFANV